VILAANGRQVTQPSEVQEVVGSLQPGDRLELVLRRANAERTVAVALGADPDEDGKTLLGVLMTSAPSGGVNVTYNLQDVGGPSAGMIFALAVIDKLSPGELTGGHVIAGTGTINDDGEVGPIGGIAHKIASARDADVELFLAPAGNCADAARTNAGDMVVASVASLDDAIAAMEDFTAGREVTTCRAS